MSLAKETRDFISRLKGQRSKVKVTKPHKLQATECPITDER